MGGTPLRAHGVEAALASASEKAEILAAASMVSELDSPPADENASSEFRLHLAEVLIRRGRSDEGLSATLSNGTVAGDPVGCMEC